MAGMQTAKGMSGAVKVAARPSPGGYGKPAKPIRRPISRR